ncbi:MAG: iron(III) transport system permease protein [Candidatus Binatota bacterium]|nr:iron(III) transport system permease protein [Candidatus Binatota bacterium]
MAKVATADALPRPRWLAIEPATICIAVLFGVVAFLVLTPLLLLLVGSFQLARPGEAPVYGFAGWRRAFTDPSILEALWNTVSLAVVRQVIALVIGVLLSWLIARTDLPWKKALEFVFWISFFLPPLPVTLGWILLLDGKFGLLNQWLQNLSIISGPIFNIYSYWGIVWVHMTTSLGVKVLLLAPAFRNLDASLEESARSCGANPVVTLVRIVIPLMMPAILVSTVLGLIRSMEAFEIELLLGVPIGLFVYSTKIRDLVAYEPPEYAAATALGSIFLVLLLILVALQRSYLGQRLYRTVSGRGFSTNPTSLGRWRWPIFSAVASVAFTVTVVPLLVLLMGTFMRAFGYFNIPRPWTIENWQRVLADPSLIKSLWNTLIVGLGTALSGAAFYALVAYVVVRRQFKGRAILDFISWLPWAIPGILMGLALLWTVFETRIFLPLYGSVYLLIIALFIKSMPFGVQIAKSVLVQLGPELEEAARISGGSWLQCYRRVLIPLLTPTFIVVGLLGFISAARDISTVVLLGSSQSRTMALLALDYAFGGQFERGAVVAFLTSLVVIIIALIAHVVGSKVGIGDHR